ncbi:MAG: cation-translocating P-type ATPase [Gemmatimonadetes bacterium]|nr:cation-translocating P-type ATPase [Gemmatimonadota bacterium]
MTGPPAEDDRPPVFRAHTSAPRELGTTQLELRVSNLDCASDATKIERGLKGMPGLRGVTVYPKAAKVVVRLGVEAGAADRVRARLRELGFPTQAGSSMPAVPLPWKNPKIIASTVSGLLLLTGWLLHRFGVGGGERTVLGPFTGLAFGLAAWFYLGALVVGAYSFAREALVSLVHERSVGIELLMTVAAVVATLLGAPGEGAMLAFLYSMSEAAEGYTEQKTRSAITALMDLAPKVALVRRTVNGEPNEVELAVEELVAGDIFIVKPGQAVATDGEVDRGGSSVNQAPVTGESAPVEKRPGDTVFAGSINGEGVLEVRATRAVGENTIARIIHLVEEAQERKGNSQRFIERFGAWYSPAVLLAGVLLALVPPLLAGGEWHEWLTRATVFIVAAAPCALVISIPITLVATLGTGARHGVLIKGGVYVEALANVRVVALDKTGTITRGRPDVTDVIVLGGASRHELLGAAATIEHRSQHPLAQAIRRNADREGIAPGEATDFLSLTGAGARGTITSGPLAGRTLFVGSPALFETRLQLDLTAVAADIQRLQEDGKSVVGIGDHAGLLGLIAIQDTVRRNAKAAIGALRAAGVERVVMLSGDNARTAAAIARQIGIDEVYADLAPEDKALRVRELTRQSGHVAMVGDGVNDAPALAEASVGIAMGAAGTDVALETADVALMADDLEKLVYALRLARRNARVIRQNVALSVAVIGVLVVGALLGRFTLPVAVIGHELSEFMVIASGLRMLRG